MKGQLVRALAARRRRMESGEDVVVGVNRFETTEPSPLQTGVRAVETVDPAVDAAAGEPRRSTGRPRRRRWRRAGRGGPGATPPRSRPRWTSCGPPPRPTPTSW